MAYCNTWTDKLCSELELVASLKYWRKHHSIGARRRVLNAIRYYRAFH